MKSIVFITDTWDSVNGVDTWIKNVKQQLEQRDFKVTVIYPRLFFNFPLPTYPEMKMALFAKKKIENIIKQEKPDYIHISTEGPLGLSALRACLKNKWKFNTFYHTRLPEYISLRFGILETTLYKYLRWFHNAAGTATYVASDSLGDILLEKGFKNVVSIPHGIDHSLFQRNENAQVPIGLTKPIFTYLGRLAPEKSIEDFLSLNLPGSKLVIGDGPSRGKLEKKYKKNTYFVGYKKAQEIVDLLSVSDVFVFPSKTDTFGLTIVEAMACGLPVAAYDVLGPKDIITSGKDGFLGSNLEENIMKCLDLHKEDCIAKSNQFSWDKTADAFLNHVIVAGV